jgi:Glycosyltransferase family 87
VRGGLWELLRPPLQGVAGVLLVAIGAAIISGQVVLWRNTIDDRDAQDFGIFLTSVRTFAAGGSLYPAAASIRNRTLYRTGQLNLNLPHTHLILMPLVGLTPQTALTIWVGASIIVIVLCALAVLQALRWRLPALWWLAIGVYLLAWGPAAAYSLTAQISLLLAGPVTAAWISLRHGRHGRAGAWLGLAAAIKPFLFLFVPYFAIRRDWRALQTFALAAATIVAAGILVFGLDAYREWASQLPRIDWATHYFNASIAGLAQRVFGRSYYASARHVWIEAMVMLAAMAAVTSVSFRRIAQRRAAEGVDSIDLDWAVLLLASLLLSPLGWVYYLWIALGPLAAAIGHSRFWQAPRRADLLLVPGLAGWLWFGKMTGWGQPNVLATATLASMYFWALLSLWLWVSINRANTECETR